MGKSLSILMAMAILVIGAMSPYRVMAQVRAADAEGHQWWQHAVFYEIYPRSFADSNNNGIGDLNGIAAKLDYLKDLGVDAIWITPCFPSPQVDFGYDVSDYEDIDPMYGSLADFDNLIAQSKQKDLKIILDFVVNHTSDRHKWFLESKASKDSPRRDWYIWRNGKPNGQPPSNWNSLFGGPAWQLDPTTGQYYYHYFYPQQPDLNWRNPAVKSAMLDIPRWWYKRGVSGFRLDAVDTLFEDPQLNDDPILAGKNKYGDPNQDERYNRGLPEVHDVMRELRTVADESNAVLIGETYTSNVAELKQYYGEHDNELQMPMDMMFGLVNKLSAPDFRNQIALAESVGSWPTYVIGNHDMRRSYDRYGDGQHNDQIAKLMAGLYLTLRGTPIMYYGEEIGMTNNDPKRKEDVKDPIGKLGWPQEKGRDGERTPMQWNGSINAGFSTVEPWLPVPATYATHNVISEAKDPGSVYQFYRHLLALRHSDRALLDGDYIALNQSDPNVLSYLRHYKDETLIVVLNMSSQSQTMSFDLSSAGVASGKKTKVVTLLTTLDPGALPVDLKKLTLDPFEVFIGKLAEP